MKLGNFFLIGILIIFVQAFALAQIDTGLPIEVGKNSNDPTKANLSGKVTVQGLDPSQPNPIIIVTALYNGILFDKRQVYENGTYLIQGVPRENVTVLVEVNGVEFGRQNIGQSIMGNIKIDFTVNMQQGNGKTQNSGVVSVKDLYPRSKDNEKLFEKATAAVKDKKLDNAIKLFKQIVESDSKDYVSWTELGTAYFRSDKLSEAEKSYNSALEQKPDFMLALLNLGKVLLAQKQAEKSIPILTKAVETEPTSADAQHYLGEAYLQIQKGSKAVTYLYEALRLAPIEKAEIHLRLAWLYNAKNLKDKAAEEYRQFLQKVPNHPDKEKMEKYIKENTPK